MTLGNVYIYIYKLVLSLLRKISIFTIGVVVEFQFAAGSKLSYFTIILKYFNLNRNDKLHSKSTQF